VDGEQPVVVIGAGPAGLAAALELSRRHTPVVVLERQERPGGLAQTVDFAGGRFDLGGHRFYTKIDEIGRLWEELLGEDFLTRDRLSRVFYQGAFYSYPLKPFEALRNLGPRRSLAIILSYLRARVRPDLPEDTFERWVSNRFGRALYETFFKAYTEKVWGIPCSQIGVEWAAQRIRDLSLGKAVWSRLNPFRRAPAAVSLIEQFRYPRLGPGMMWDACVRASSAEGAEVRLNHEVLRIRHEGDRVLAVEVAGPQGPLTLSPGHVISTMPLADLLLALDPQPPEDVATAARGLRRRAFLTVALLVETADTFPDNWVYVHDPSVRVGRVQNFRNWSPAMMPSDTQTIIGMEYFCDEGDSLWTAADADLRALAQTEILRLGLLSDAAISDATVVRVRDAYPIYDPGYEQRVATARAYLAGFANLRTCGRGGLHRYNNLDHSMLTGLYAARNVTGEAHDVWSVNVEAAHVEDNA